MNLLARFYSGLPVIRELTQIRNALYRLDSDLKRQQLLRLSEFDLKQHPRYTDPKRLLRHSFQVSSQNGEDGILQEIFRRIGSTNKVFAEIGVGDGTENNSAFLLSIGWTGFWLDANGRFLEAIAKRPDLANGAVRGLSALVTRENVANLFAQLGVPAEFDLLSIDIDQNTYYIWEALPRYRPRVVVVEYNASIPPEIDWRVHYEAHRVAEGSINFGASLKAFELLGRRLGYCLVGCEFSGTNVFFVREDLVSPGAFCEPFTAENHFEPPRYFLAQRSGHGPAILDRQTPAGSSA